jgi:oligoribonuclease NrnB/cAMP/cGMP phosphodiesterase (DHH superfamily)
MLPDEVDIVIYHAPCPDGFGSALSAYMYFKNKNGVNKNENVVQYHPTSFKTPPPQVKDKNVLMCDFSYKYDVMMKIISEAKSVFIIDHHKSAEAELKMIDDKYKLFDMNHSGAYLTWKYFFPEIDTVSMPMIIQYIEDHDIWKHVLPNTREITSYISTLPFEFEEYEKLLDDEYLTKTILPLAIGMNKQNVVYIDKAMSFSTMKFVQIDDKYYFVSHINSSILKSEIGNQILTVYPNCDFSSIYSTNNNTSYISLRSEEGRSDVSLIATKYGGGGHKFAAGIALFNTSETVGKLLDDNVMYGLLENIYFGQFDYLGNKLDVVYLNTTHHRKHIGKYLLQERSKDGDVSLQQCSSIYRNKYGDKTFNKYCAFSCVWNYDGLNDKTWFSLLWNDVTLYDTNTSEIVKYLFGKFDDYNYIDSDKRIIFTRKGLLGVCL